MTLVLVTFFLNMTPQVRETKAKNKQVGLHQNKKLLHSKRKRPPVEGERVFANSISNKGLIFKIHKELLQLNINKANHQIFLKCIEDTL